MAMNPTVNANGYVEEIQKGSARYLYLPALVAAIGGRRVNTRDALDWPA